MFSRHTASLTCAAMISVTACQAADRVIVAGNQGLDPIRLRDLARGSKVELYNALFNTVNSRNDSPTRDRTCRSGEGDVNRYPMAIEDSEDVRVYGGRFDGTVPQGSDWVWTYCNSAALRIETSEGASVSGLRMRYAWDGIRIDRRTHDFEIDGVWMSSIRDDCVENDEMMDGRITDSLLDGCFAGISVAPIRNIQHTASVEMTGVLLRMQSYSYRDEIRHALPFKVKRGNVRLEVHDSVFAVETRDIVGGENAEKMWTSIEACSNNLLLWLGDGRMPEEFRRAPKCFRILTGDAAHATWQQKRADWLKDHPEIKRFDDEDARG